MASTSAVRRHIADVARRLLALLEESMAPANAVRILVAESVLPPQSGTPAAPLAGAVTSLIAGAGKSGALARVADYVAALESRGCGEAALRLLGSAQIRGSNPGRKVLVLVAVEFCLLVLILSTLSIFVLPQFKAVFEGFSMPLPAFTRMAFAILGPASPFLWLIVLALLIGFAWRMLAGLLGNALLPIDWLLLRLPLAGTSVRQSNGDRLAGWLGFAAADAPSQRTAVEAAQAWFADDVLGRECAQVLRAADAGKDVPTSLARAGGFDREFHAAVALPDRADSLAALRARWRSARSLPEQRSGFALAVVQVLLGVVVAAIVIALYLPIFKLGSIVG
jgi:hypothetical protein